MSRRTFRTGRFALQGLAFLAVVGFVAVTAIDPYSGAVASQYFTVMISNPSNLPAQGLTSAGGYQNAVARDQYTMKAPSSLLIVSNSSAMWRPPAAAIPDPGSARALGLEAVLARGWGMEEYACLDALFTKESNWRVNAYNASSGAYGIPQSLPGTKMASVGDDWETNPATQIEWGLRYIEARKNYRTPCGAWAHSESHNWY